MENVTEAIEVNEVNEIYKAKQLIAEKIKQDDNACINEINEVLKKYGRMIDIKNHITIKQTES